MRRSRTTALASVLLLAACGTQTSASDQPLGADESADLPSGLQVSVRIHGVAGDDHGSWLNAGLHVANPTDDRVPLPALSIRCNGSVAGESLPAASGEEHAALTHVDPSSSHDLEVRLLLPGDRRDTRDVPKCLSDAYVEIRDDGGASTAARWQVPDDVLTELNTSRRNGPPPDDPDGPTGPPKDPDRPYAWVDDDPYADGYDVTFVRGASVADVLEVLRVTRSAGRLDTKGVWELSFELMDERTHEGPPVVTVDELDGGVVVFAPVGHFLRQRQLRALSTGGVAATFGLTVNYDTYVFVARAGRLVRRFDPFLGQSWGRQGPLREERGLDFENDTGPASWTLLERLTDIHVTREWLERAHPAYVLEN